MSIKLQVLLFLVTLFCFFNVVKKVKKGKFKIEYAIVWILVTLGLLVIALFPVISIQLSHLLGIVSPVNFVFLCIIFILGIVVYILSLKVSALEEKIYHLVEYVAVKEKTEDENNK